MMVKGINRFFDQYDGIKCFEMNRSNWLNQLMLFKRQYRYIQLQVMSDQNAFKIVRQLIHLDILEFEKQLSQHILTPFLIKSFAQILFENPPYQILITKEIKNLAAIGINKIIAQKININHLEWRNIWNQYYQQILMHSKINQINWEDLYITGKALEILMDEFGKQFCSILVPLFSQISFKSQVLLYDTFLITETTIETRIIFIRETFESYLKNSLSFIQYNHQNSYLWKKQIKFQEKIIQNFKLMLVNLQKKDEQHSEMNELLLKISMNKQMHEIICSQLQFNVNNDGCQQNKIIYFSEFEEDKILEGRCNSIKADTLSILTCLVKMYHHSSGIQEFDHYPILYLMQNMVPQLIRELAHKISNKNTSYLLEKQNLIINQIQFLTRASKFLFLLDIFRQNAGLLLFCIVFKLLKLTDIQIDCYNDNDKQFIQNIEDIVENKQQSAPTIQNTCSILLQQLTVTLDGSLIDIVQYCINCIHQAFNNEDQAIIKFIQSKYGQNELLKIDGSLIILSVFSDIYQNRPDLIQILRNKLLIKDSITKFQGYNKALLLIFLSYNYTTIYKQFEEEGIKFLVMANECIDQQNLNSTCALMLFQNCLQLDFGEAIWNNLVSKITQSQNIKLFSLIQRIIKEKLDKLPSKLAVQLISQLIKRLVIEYQIAQQVARDKNANQIMGSPILYGCLQILQEITENKKYLKEQISVVNAIWPVFDFFEFSDKIQFQDTVLIIFNNILKANLTITDRYFQFLPFFVQIQNKNNQFGLLLKTYTMILNQGAQYFESGQKGLSKLLSLIETIQLGYGVTIKEQNLRHICILMHYIITSFSSLVQKDVQFYQKILYVYSTKKDILQPETLASIINLIIAMQCSYGGCDASILFENKIQIFKGYQAKLLGMGLRKLIQKYIQQDIIGQYLKVSIRLLHYTRQINKNQPNHHYLSPNFTLLQKLDPFVQISASLDFLKYNIDTKRYDSLIEDLKKQISLGQVRDLLTKRLVEKQCRTFVKVRIDQN